MTRDVVPKLDQILDLLDEKVGSAGTLSVPTISHQASERAKLDKYDVFVSHCKKLSDSEDRAVWVADVVESHGIRPFFDRSELQDITEPALKKALLASGVVVTVLDPFTFNSMWVFMENLFAINNGIPVVPVYDADRFRWAGQLDKWLKLYPWIFVRQVVPITKSQRRTSVEALVGAIRAAQDEVAGGRKPLEQPIGTSCFGGSVKAKIGVGGSRETETREAVDTAHKGMLSRLDGNRPSLIVCAFTCTHDAEQVAKRIHELSPSVPMVGCTSCRGVVLNSTWLTHRDEVALGMWGVCDDAGTYTVIHVEERSSAGNLRDEVLAQTAAATKQVEEAPSFVLLLGCPGHEEVILSGIQAAVGMNVPIIGGGSADNSVEGLWRQIACAGTSNFSADAPVVSSGGLAIAICWASCEVAATFTSGYEHAGKSGTVTKVSATDRGRTLLEIDGRPAGDVYQEWTGSKMPNEGPPGQRLSILRSTAFSPLGESMEANGGIRVIHPGFFNPTTKALTTFADAREGMPICLLITDKEKLARRIATTAKRLSEGGEGAGTEARVAIGALNILCGGQAVACEDAMPAVAEQLAKAAGHISTLGLCCFGQQGTVAGGPAVHGNLMFGCLVFFDRPRRKARSSDKEVIAQEISTIAKGSPSPP